MLGRRRRRYPSLQAFATSLHHRRQDGGMDHPPSSSPQDEGLQRSLLIPRPHPTWSPTWDSAHCNRPRTEKRVTCPICNSFPVITVCNPPLWEYSRDNPGAWGHKRPYIKTLDTRAPINTPVQGPWEAGSTEQLPSRVKLCLHSLYSPVRSSCPGEQVPTTLKFSVFGD
jgi:hypothetical protein